MKRMNIIHTVTLLIITVIIVSVIACSNNQKTVIPESMKYLGETPPGTEARLFYGGDFVPNEKGEKRCFNVAFSPLGNEMFFSYYQGTREKQHPEYRIMTFKFKDGKWIEPTAASFSGTYSDVDINFSPDGNYLFFASTRKHFETADLCLYFSKRTPDGWSEPVYMSDEGDSIYGEVLPSMSQKGNLFFRSSRPESYSDVDVYRAKWNGGTIYDVQNLGPNVNSEFGQTDPAIAPDESYVLFVSSRPDVYDGAYLIYVSFQIGDNEWTESVLLGPEVNSEIGAGAPTITPDGKYLFFKKRRGENRGIYWISTKVIEDMREDL